MEKLGQILKQMHYSVYELLKVLWDKVNDVIDDLNNKVNKNGDFNGTWNGLTPSQTDLFISSKVDSLEANINVIDGKYVDLAEELQIKSNLINLKPDINTVYTKDLVYQKAEVDTIANGKRDKNVKIISSDLDTSSDANKIKPINISDELMQMFSPSGSVSPVIPQYSLTEDKLANGMLYVRHLSSEYNYFGILTSVDNLNNVLKTGVYMVQATVSQPLNVPEALKLSTSILINQRYEAAYTTQFMFDFVDPTLIMTRTLSGTTPIKDWQPVGNTHKLAGKKILTMGDSITSPNKYQNEIKKITGATIVNAGVSGAKFTFVEGHDDVNPYSFWKLAQTVDLIDIDYIFVNYGTNDYSNDILLGTATENNPAHFKSAIYEGLKTLMLRKPSLKIIFATPIYRMALRNGSTMDDIDITPNTIANLYMKEYVDAIKEVCSKFRVPVFDAYNECGINKFNIDTYLSDKLHPNDVGHELIGRRYADFINNYI